MVPRESLDPPSATLRRIRSAVLDPRLVVGVLLVAGSAAGVVALVSTADDTVDIYVATQSLVPGDELEESDLVVRGVRLAAAEDHYLVPGEIPAAGLIVSRPVSEGELIPRSAVGSARNAALAAVVVSTPGALSSSIVAGASVDLWSAAEKESGHYGTPAVLVDAAVVVRLLSTDSIVAGGEVTAVELLVPRASVARVLEAIANDAALSIVPSSLPLER